MGGRGRLSLPAACAFAVLIAAIPARAAEFLALAGRIPLPEVTGRIDHLAVDLSRQRLFVAEYGNGTVEVVDLASGRRIRRISGLSEPQGVGYSAQTDILAVSNGGGGMVRLYWGGDLVPIGAIALGRDADNVRVDPRSGNFIVGHGGLAILDPARRQRIADIALPAHPEAFQRDAAAGRVFANVPDAEEIAVVDLAAGRPVAKWTVPGLRGNFPMALGGDGRLLAVVFRRPPRLVLLDAGTGVARAGLSAAERAWWTSFGAARPAIDGSGGRRQPGAHGPRCS